MYMGVIRIKNGIFFFPPKKKSDHRHDVLKSHIKQAFMIAVVLSRSCAGLAFGDCRFEAG